MEEPPDTEQPSTDRGEGPRDQPDDADELHEVPGTRNPGEDRETD
jgi:hypothetical protein